MSHPVAPTSQDRRSSTKQRLARSFSILATLAALQGLQACGNDDEDEQPPAPPPPAQAVSSCEGGTFLFCEDFEALANGPATSAQWTIAQSTGASA